MTSGHKRRARIDWLIENQHLWKDFSDNAENFHPDKWKEIVAKMRKNGLVAPTTNWMDVNLANLIKKARQRQNS
jgi:hypothetical protein